MTDTAPLAPALDALADSEKALLKLDLQCCEPGRSPRMHALGETLQAARRGLDEITRGADAGETLTHLEDAGAQLGSLQVGCCAPGRLPLYARMLENLTTAQLAINRAIGAGH